CPLHPQCPCARYYVPPVLLVCPRTPPPSFRSLSFYITALTPKSPLFPYTTLFRSRERHLSRGRRPAGPPPRLRRDAPHRQGHLGDRKSTRLNSSHVSISYAVFCLKKKI